jgi:hypothetical protein
MEWREFFEKTPLEEIHHTTKISILSLQMFINGEFTKMPRVRFYGFVRLLKSHYPEVDFDPLVAEYEKVNPKTDDIPVVTQEAEGEEHLQPFTSRFPAWVWVVGGVAVLAVGYFLFGGGEKKEPIPETPTHKVKVVKLDYNISQYVPPPTIATNTTAIAQEANISRVDQNGSEEGNLTSTAETNGSVEKVQSFVENRVVLTPTQRVWVLVKNLETGKVVVNRVLKPGDEVDLNGTRYYIKTGNQYLEIAVGERKFGLSKDGVNRILIEDGNITINGEKVSK